MTWHWSIGADGDLQCWDHTQDPSVDPPVATRSPPDGGSGWSWTGDYPDVVLDEMYAEATAAVDSADITRAVTILLDMAGEQITRYTGESA